MNNADHDALLDHRARIAHEQQKNDERRIAESAQQSSPLNTIEARIHLWERRHHLSLPTSHDHRLLDVIAAATALTLADVHEEQRRRAAAKVATLKDGQRKQGAPIGTPAVTQNN